MAPEAEEAPEPEKTPEAEESPEAETTEQEQEVRNCGNKAYQSYLNYARDIETKRPGIKVEVIR